MRRAFILAMAVTFVGASAPHSAQALFLKDVGKTLRKWGKQIKRTARNIGKKISRGLRTAGKKVKTFFNNVGRTLKSWGQQAKKALTAASSKARDWVRKNTRKISFLWKNIMPRFKDPGVRFRFPVENPREFDSSVIWHLDTVRGKLGKAMCRNYRGGWGPLSCYGGHRGTDYRLKGGFKSMDNLRVGWIVAAAGGTVTSAYHNHFDRCTALDLKAFFSKGAVGVTCRGEKFNSSRHHANVVTVEHTPTLRTKYVHLKTGSIPWLAQFEAAKRAGRPFRLRCGQRVGLAGSSGMSSFPHLHFHVERKDGSGNWVPVDPYAGRFSQRYSYWVRQNSRGFPSTACQK